MEPAHAQVMHFIHASNHSRQSDKVGKMVERRFFICFMLHREMCRRILKRFRTGKGNEKNDKIARAGSNNGHTNESQ